MSEQSSIVSVQSLDHVTLVVADLERSRAFYVATLGMREVERPGFSFPGLWFQAGPTQIHLILEHEDSGPAGSTLPENLVKSRTHHFAFRVADARAAAEALTEQGVPLLSGPRVRPDGAIQVFLRDPDGHVVELTSGG